MNKEIEALPRYVVEHVGTMLEKKQDNQVKKVLELIGLKYGRS